MKCSINTKLLPIKAHFFIFFAGLSTVVPYIPVIAQNLGITASALGVIGTFISLFGVLAKPLFGAVADHFQKLKPLLLAVLIGSTVAYFAIDFIPQARQDLLYIDIPVTVAPYGFLDEETTFRVQGHASCIQALNDRQPQVINLICSNPDISEESGFTNTTDLLFTDLQLSPFYPEENALLYPNKSKSVFDNVTDSVTDLDLAEITWFATANTTCRFCYDCRLRQPSRNFNKCPLIESKDPYAIYRTYQFWLFFFFAIISRAGTYVLVSLSDTACYEILEGKVEDYGKQRLWGSAGWGLFSLVGGFLINFWSIADGEGNYSLGFYIMVALYAVDLVILYFIDLKSPPVAESIWKNVGSVIRKLEVSSFLVAVFAVGVLTGYQWTYLYWFLKDLGASTLLLGLALCIQCFFGEVPFFFITGWVIDKIGFLNALSLTLLSFGFRFLYYSYLVNPWLVLPLELLEGVTFGLFYSTITSYAKVISPEGTEATIQGLICGTFDGLGLAFGGLLGGFAIDQLGCSSAFRVMSYLAFIMFALHVSFHLLYVFYLKSDSESPATNGIGNGKENTKKEEIQIAEIS